MTPRDGVSSRPARVGERIREELSALFEAGFVRDADFKKGLVTVTEVEVTKDLRHATAFVSIYPMDEPIVKSVLDALGRATRALRRELAGRLAMRFVPELRFGHDASAEYGERIDRVLNEIKASGASPNPEGSNG